MATLKSATFNTKSYTLDDHGFLDPPNQWDENFAEGMANQLGIREGLTQEHWQVIHYLRQKFLEEMTVPVVVTACIQNSMKLSRLKALFPSGYHRGACRIAGINYHFMYETNYWLTYETGRPMKARYPLDDLGFLEAFEEWDDDFVDFIVDKVNLSSRVTEEHRKVLSYLREYYGRHRNIPLVYETCSANSLTHDDLQKLFPEGYRRGACRMAGLPFYA
jgi:tRNA 2-thiouridine synthesizing protein E